MTNRFSRRGRRTQPVLLELEPRILFSYDVSGVQPAALDQPQVNAIVRTGPTADPLVADVYGATSYNVQAFLDTGASGVLLSVQSADALGLARSSYNGQSVVYSDVGVAGSDTFNVSNPLYTSLGVYGGAGDINIDPNDPFGGLGGSDPPVSSYTQTFGPIQFQIGAVPEPDNPLLQGLDVFGTPVIMGKVMVMDPRPLNAVVDSFGTDPTSLLGGSMRTYLYNPGTAYNAATDDTDPGIPGTNRHVALSYASFNRFTTVMPAGATGPTMGDNPFIGPNPVNQLDPNAPADNTPGVTIKLGDQTATGSFLLDTGAAASMISLNTAAKLGVHYKEGTYGTDAPILVDADGNELPNQFNITVGGIGGTIKSAGFWLDEMDLPTTEHDPIRFVSAPVLVSDISVMDPVTQQSLTLDGIFGMNYLVASAFISESSTGGLPDIGQMSKSPFNFVVFDSQARTLGFDIPDLGNTPAPPTAVLGSASNVTTAGGTSYSFTVHYSGLNPISVASLDASDLLVTGPNDQTLVATPVTASLSDSTDLTVTYTITPPGGAWDLADCGSYTVSLQPGQVTDSASLAVVPAVSPLGSFAVALPATASLVFAPNVTKAGGTSYSFTVNYSGPNAISVASLDSSDLLVTGPNNQTLIATPVTTGLTNSKNLTVTYRITPPGGAWDTTDSGTYTLALKGDQVTDTFPLAAAPAASPLGSFRVTISDTTPPKATLVRPSAPVAGKRDFTFSIIYTDDVAINLATIGAGDVQVTGPRRFSQLATVVSKKVNSSKRVTVTYRIIAPNRKWSATAAGTYTIALRANQVSDTAHNWARSATLGKFAYAVHSPP